MPEEDLGIAEYEPNCQRIEITCRDSVSLYGGAPDEPALTPHTQPCGTDDSSGERCDLKDTAAMP